MSDVEGGIGHQLHMAFAGSGEEMDVGGFLGADMIGKGRAVRLDTLRVGLENIVTDWRVSTLGDGAIRVHDWARGDVDGDGNQGIVLEGEAS